MRQRFPTSNNLRSKHPSWLFFKEAFRFIASSFIETTDAIR